MWVCICNAVTDREVNAAIASGACTRDAVTMACGAGGDCGTCHHLIEQLIEEHPEARASALPASLSRELPPAHDVILSPASLVRHPERTNRAA